MTDLGFTPVYDISHWEGKNFDLARAENNGLAGVISKCCQYGYGLDPDYIDVQQAVRKQGLLSGGYMFLVAGAAKPQVDLFLTHAYITDNTLVAVDHEKNLNRTRPSLATLIEALELLEKETGRKAVIYSGNDLKEQMGNAVNSYLAQHRLWLSDYRARPIVQRSWKRPWLWQCTGDGAGPYGRYGTMIGLGHKLDANHFYGTKEQLQAEWSGLKPHQVVAELDPVYGPEAEAYVHVGTVEENVADKVATA